MILPHLDAAYNFARFLTRDASAAQDVAQDALLRAWRAFGGYRGGDAKAWLLAIVRNCWASWAQAQQRERGTAAPVEELSASTADGPETSLLRLSEAEQVRAVLAALPEPFRATLVLRELEELSYREIAAITAVPIGTVMSRLARARQMLGAKLEGAL